MNKSKIKGYLLAVINLIDNDSIEDCKNLALALLENAKLGLSTSKGLPDAFQGTDVFIDNLMNIYNGVRHPYDWFPSNLEELNNFNGRTTQVKIEMIRLIKAVSHCGLKDSKDFFDLNLDKFFAASIHWRENLKSKHCESTPR